MDNLVSVINKLQVIFSRAKVSMDVKLPQIVVVGAQSSGKSSVIESIVGKDILPRGIEIVTRTPIIIQLVNVKNKTEWAEFSHLPKEKFEDFYAVLKEIEKQTVKLCGKNKNISGEAIILKIFSPSVVDLTLVDLPGIVKVPIGDQPSDIEVKVRNLILDYISNPSAIILAISPANSDLANSDSLKIAREVDPNYQRTLGVITKLDLMEEGTNAVAIIQNKVFPLKYGYIGVVLRSQQDTTKNISISSGVIKEQEFFVSRKEYDQVSHLCGIPVLTKVLSELLMSHIKNSLPTMREDIVAQIYKKEEELEAFGCDFKLTENDILNSFVLNTVSKFNHTYCEMIDGRFVKECAKQFIGGARINYIFNDVFKKEIDDIDPFDMLSDDDIRTAIKNSNGLKTALFIPEAAFENLVKQQIGRLLQPSLYCVKRVFEELKLIVTKIEINEFNRYKKLEFKVKQVMENVLHSCLEPTNVMVRNLVEIEKAFINTSHPDFLGSEQSMLNIFDENNQMAYGTGVVRNYPLNGEESDLDKSESDYRRKLDDFKGSKTVMRPGVPTSKDKMETCIIKNLISSYFAVVKKNISDLVPKTVMHFLVNQSKLTAEKDMVTNLYNAQELTEILQEDPIIAERRQVVKEMVGSLKESLDIISEIRDLKL